MWKRLRIGALDINGNSHDAKMMMIYDLYSTLQSAKYNTNKRKKEQGTDRQIYTVVAHINVSHEQIG